MRYLLLSILYIKNCMWRWQLDYAMALYSKMTNYKLDISVGDKGITIQGLDELLDRLDSEDIISGGSQVCGLDDDVIERHYDAFCDEYNCAKLRIAVNLASKLSKEQLMTYACFKYGLCTRKLAAKLFQYRTETAIALIKKRLATYDEAAAVAGYNKAYFMRIAKMLR
jgi:hypothetical protein